MPARRHLLDQVVGRWWVCAEAVPFGPIARLTNTMSGRLRHSTMRHDSAVEEPPMWSSVTLASHDPSHRAHVDVVDTLGIIEH
jgi:hypothetical protein